MRTLLIFVLVVAGAFAQESAPAAKPIDPAKRAAIEELFSLMKVDQMQKQMVSQVQAMVGDQIEKSLPPEIQKSQDGSKMVAEVKDFQKRVFDLMMDRVDFARMKPDYIRLYDETFSAEEVAGLVAFYKTPVGQSYLSKMPVLTSKTVVLIQRMLGDLMPQMMKMTADWANEMKTKYGDAGAH